MSIARLSKKKVRWLLGGGLLIVTMVCAMQFIGARYTFHAYDGHGQDVSISGVLASWSRGSIEDGICSIEIVGTKDYRREKVLFPEELKLLFHRCGYDVELVFHETTSYGTSISLFWDEGKNEAILHTFPETQTSLMHDSADPFLNRNMKLDQLKYKFDISNYWMSPHEAWNSPKKFVSFTGSRIGTIRAAKTVLLEKDYGSVRNWGFRSNDDFSYFLGFDRKAKKWKLYEQGYTPGRDNEWLTQGIMMDTVPVACGIEIEAPKRNTPQPLSKSQEAFLEAFKKTKK